MPHRAACSALNLPPVGNEVAGLIGARSLPSEHWIVSASKATIADIKLSDLRVRFFGPGLRSGSCLGRIILSTQDFRLPLLFRREPLPCLLLVELSKKMKMVEERQPLHIGSSAWAELGQLSSCPA